jgi:plastocyanin
MKKTRIIGFSTLSVVSILGVLWFSTAKAAESRTPITHTIFMTALEVKGSTDKLTPPDHNPKDLSKGYGYDAPGEFDKTNPKKWQVASYLFNPAFVTVRQGDTVKLTVFVVNGDTHDVKVVDPEGKKVVADTVWNRGREYHTSFTAEKVGVYQLICSEHAPTMTANFLVVP